MTDRETIIKGCENWVNTHKGENYLLTYSSVVELLTLLKEQEGTINELQNAYGYLQKQFFETQDKLLKEQEERIKELELEKEWDKYPDAKTLEEYLVEFGVKIGFLTSEKAEQLLKEQEPTIFQPHYIDIHGKHFVCGVECGACHKEISSTYHYCPYCGREVKWE